MMGRDTRFSTDVNVRTPYNVVEEKSAHAGEKFETQPGKRHSGAPAKRCAIGDLELEANGLSRVPDDRYARFCGGGVVATSSRYPTLEEGGRPW
jgi:hypothetical protein